MIVGQREQPALQLLGDQDMRAVLGRLRTSKHPTDFAFRTCTSPRALVACVEEAAGREPIELLDIYYHGAPGRIALGGVDQEHVLFASDEGSRELVGATIARALGALLRPTAQVRILGCRGAVGTRGRMLLIKLAHELGASRVVLAPILDIIPNHFGSRGTFTTPEYLFSSLGALDREAPSKHERDFDTPTYP